MSKVVERMTQQIYPSKWADLEELDKKYAVVESKHGFPAKRRYRLFIGGGSLNTLVIEREWESMAAMEAAFEKSFGDPEWQALEVESSEIIADVQVELLMPM